MANGEAAMEGDEVARAWGAYRESIAELYEQDVDWLISQRGEMAEAPSEGAVEHSLDRSEKLGAAIVSHLESEGSEQRELAILQLSAAAVIDLSVADDLARRAEE